VRLAFAVAAHLETDVLILDEVLAVGGCSISKEVFGKMEEGKKENSIITVES